MKKMNTALRLLTITLCVMLMLCALAPTAVFAAENDAISDLAIAHGEDGVKTLEDEGYTVMGRPLTGDYWLGYKKGGNAVTDIVVSSNNGESVNVDEISYQRVGSLGDTGNLFLTRDKGAGSALLSVNLQSNEEYADQPFYALRNDGTVPLRRDNGAPCNLGADCIAYLFLLKDNVFRPYIKSVKAVAGDDLRSAISAAAAAGCEWYYDPNLKTDGGKTVVIGYVRTTNESDAITCLAAGEEAPQLEKVTFDPAGEILIAGEPAFRLFQTRARSVGNPIIGLTGSAVPVRSTDVMNKWAEKVFVKFNTSASSVNKVKSEALYQQFLKDDSPLTNVPVLIPSADSARTPLAYVCKAQGQPENIFPVSQESTQPPTEAASAPETEPETAPADDFDPQTYLEDTAEKIADDNAPEDTVASVFGGGTTLGFIVVLSLAALGVAGGIAAFAVRSRKRKAQEGQDDES